MSELRDLYQEVILDHGRKPRNFHLLDDATHRAKGYNPLCGDQLELTVQVEGDTIQDVGFTGQGCAISTASASLMSGALKGKSRGEAQAMFERVHALLTEEGAEVDLDALGKLAVFSGVREFPARVKCASLCWHTLQAALEDKGEAVSTE